MLSTALLMQPIPKHLGSKITTQQKMRCKLIAIYNPLVHFSHQYLAGYDVSNSHKTTSFNMNYREYHQQELYLILNGIYWVSQNIKVKYVFDSIEYKKLDLQAKYVPNQAKYYRNGPLTMTYMCGISHTEQLHE